MAAVPWRSGERVQATPGYPACRDGRATGCADSRAAAARWRCRSASPTSRTYGFTVLAARILGPHQYGAVAAPDGHPARHQRAAARAPGHRRAADRGRAGAPRRDRARGAPGRLALGRSGSASCCWSLSPLLDGCCGSTAWPRRCWSPPTSVPLTLMGAQSGVLQGERRWAPLSLIYLALGDPAAGHRRRVHRLAADRDRRDARHRDRRRVSRRRRLAGAAPAARDRGAVPDAARRAPAPDGDILRETAHNSQALLAFFALSNADIIVARHALDDHQAGLYAVGPDPDQGDAVPAAVRRGRRLPRHVDRRRATAGPAPEPRAGRGPRASSASPARCLLPAAGAGLRRRRRLRRDRRTSSGSSRSSAPCCRCSSCWSTPSWPAAAAARSYLVWLAFVRC